MHEINLEHVVLKVVAVFAEDVETLSPLLCRMDLDAAVGVGRIRERECRLVTRDIR